MRVLHVDTSGELHLLPSLPTSWSRETEQGLLWLDLDGTESVAAIEELLTQAFGFHPLAIDDALHEVHVPKLDDWESYLYLVLQDVTYDANQQTIRLPELDIFLGKRFLVTYHHDKISTVDRVWEKCQHNNRWLQHGADHILYRIIDAIVDSYTAAIERLEADLFQLESEIFDDPAPRSLERLTHFKRIILQLRRTLDPQREVVNKLARDNYAVISPKDRIYFRDVYDHMVRLHTLNDNIRDLVVGSTEIYLSVVNNRMNDIMKTLTIITTLFMPLTFLTGFFGMNFFQAVLPARFWTGTGMLTLVLAVMLLMPPVMAWWMRRRAWM